MAETPPTLPLLAALQVQLWADDGSRCNDCAWCSISSFACGLCIVEAVGRNGRTRGPDAYAECNNGSWEVYCGDREAG